MLAAAGGLAWRWLSKSPTLYAHGSDVVSTDQAEETEAIVAESPQHEEPWNVQDLMAVASDDRQPDNKDEAEPVAVVEDEPMIATEVSLVEANEVAAPEVEAPVIEENVESPPVIVAREPLIERLIAAEEAPEIAPVVAEAEQPSPFALAPVEPAAGPEVESPSAVNQPETIDAPSAALSPQASDVAPATRPSVTIANSAAWLLGLDPLPVIHEEPAWEPHPALSRKPTAPLHSPAPMLAMGAEFPDHIEIPAAIEASSPADEPVVDKPITKGLLGKIFYVPDSRPKTAPLADSSSARETPVTPPKEAFVFPMALKPLQPAGIHLPPPRIAAKVADVQVTEITADHAPSLPTAVIDRITSKTEPLAAARRIVPLAPVAAGGDDKKSRLSWWK